eukprot:5618777-Pleurochrysis_carterae.AAC.1
MNASRIGSRPLRRAGTRRMQQFPKKAFSAVCAAGSLATAAPRALRISSQVQQELARPGELERFVSAGDAAELRQVHASPTDAPPCRLPY